MVVLPIGNMVGALFVTETTAQLSDVIGVPNSNPVIVQPEVDTVEILLGATIVGTNESITVTVCVPVVVLPLVSMTVHVTIVVPIPKTVGALFVTDATAQLSEVIGLPNATPVALHEAFALIVTFEGTTNEGFVTSVTTTN